MKTVLICPSPRPAVQLLSEAMPLTTWPLLGENLLTYWLAHLAASGVERVWVLAHDRPELVQTVTGTGARWGLKLDVSVESRELTPGEAWLKFSAENHPALSRENIVLMDHLPGRSNRPLFTSYAAWFAEALAWIPKAKTPDRVGVRELAPGVWTARHSRISRQAILRPPCWIGRHAIIGPGAIIGPEAVVEDGAMVERKAEVTRSYIGCDTFVGRFTRIEKSLAWSNLLLHWETGHWTRVPDPFLLCALRTAKASRPEPQLRSAAADHCAPAKDEGLLPWKQLLINKEG